MAPVYRLLGLSVAVVQQGMDGESRRRVYAADITYVTAKEAGFEGGSIRASPPRSMKGR